MACEPKAVWLAGFLYGKDKNAQKHRKTPQMS